ncbi:MAG TPA: group III truncated hemoglobin [Mycobacterium sp.]
MSDLASRADVDALLRRFYGQALHDDVLYEPFTELRDGGLEAHLPVMCDFWETVLFRAGLYKGSAMTVHRQLHALHPLHAGHFVRWLTLWAATVDDMFSGPNADRAVVQAARVAWAMNRHVTGADAADLTALATKLQDAHPPRNMDVRDM